MKTVNEVSKLSGVSIRTLHYYDSIGLLIPTKVTESGYRMYDDITLKRLQSILLFRELQFPLKDIKAILESPNFDYNKAIEQQITLLQMKKEQIEKLIDHAREIQTIGVNVKMDFSAFDTKKMDEYAKEAKEKWGQTDAYKEYEKKSNNRSKNEQKDINEVLMNYFVEFGEMREYEPADERVQEQVKRLQMYITDNFYTCTPQILESLGEMYVCGGSMTDNINKAGGAGTAQLVADAIRIFCSK